MKSKTTIRELALVKKANGISTAQIARSLNLSQRTIQRWIKQGNTHRGKLLRASRRKLTSEEEHDLLEFISKRPDIIMNDIIEHTRKS